MSCGNVCCTGAGARSPEVEGNPLCSEFEILKGEGKKNMVYLPGVEALLERCHVRQPTLS